VSKVTPPFKLIAMRFPSLPNAAASESSRELTHLLFLLDHHVANCCTDLAIKKVEAELTRFIVARSFSNYHRLKVAVK